MLDLVLVQSMPHWFDAIHLLGPGMPQHEICLAGNVRHCDQADCSLSILFTDSGQFFSSTPCCARNARARRS